MSTSNNIVGKPAYQSPLVDARGYVTRDWLPWLNQLALAGQSTANASSAISTLQAQSATSATTAVTLTADLAAANASLTLANTAVSQLQALTGALQAASSAVSYPAGGRKRDGARAAARRRDLRHQRHQRNRVYRQQRSDARLGGHAGGRARRHWG